MRSARRQQLAVLRGERAFADDPAIAALVRNFLQHYSPTGQPISPTAKMGIQVF